MAIAFAQVKYLSRSKALQATAAAAYRSCSKVYDERTGVTQSFSSKPSRVSSMNQGAILFNNSSTSN